MVESVRTRFRCRVYIQKLFILLHVPATCKLEDDEKQYHSDSIRNNQVPSKEKSNERASSPTSAQKPGKQRGGQAGARAQRGPVRFGRGPEGSVRATCGSAGPTVSSLSQQVLRAPSPASSKACAFSKNGAGRRAPSGSRPCHEAAGTKRVSRGRSGARGRARLGLGQGFGRSGPAGAAASAAFPQTALGGSGMEDKRGVLAAAAEASGEARKPDASDCERPTGAPSA